MASLRQVNPTSRSLSSAQHERAEALLEAAQECRDERKAARLRKEAVVLTLDLADSFAHRYRGRGIDIDDLVQVARMALVKSALGYRNGKGSGFTAYASATISGELKRHFRDFAWSVRPPRRLQEHRADLVAEEERLRHELHRTPSVTELAEALDLDCAEVREAAACSAAYRAHSLDAPTPHGTTVGESLASPQDDFEVLETSAALGCLIKQLSDREREILRLRFVEEKTQSEIGAALGVSQMQVSRLLSSILGRLRADLVDERATA
ncbi:sigma-70 family RNA polymerase sigma factor [Pedococcus sp. 5OH_020]|uniref:sigma-70 family RNA polymerase sigma factor n=1 Tax=Pedococcus sp. 5OH_020 TaxID=2989814 RepID=UPI0022E9AF60|nr:sigma-70 family RNA polymerase sigma factor [Pedococcus sp. 5OH_020]